LPSNTEINPREKVKAITLRSGKEVERNHPLRKTQEEEPKTVEIEEEAPKEKEVASPLISA